MNLTVMTAWVFMGCVTGGLVLWAICAELQNRHTRRLSARRREFRNGYARKSYSSVGSSSSGDWGSSGGGDSDDSGGFDLFDCISSSNDPGGSDWGGGDSGSDCDSGGGDW